MNYNIKNTTKKTGGNFKVINKLEKTGSKTLGNIIGFDLSMIKQNLIKKEKKSLKKKSFLSFFGFKKKPQLSRKVRRSFRSIGGGLFDLSSQALKTNAAIRAVESTMSPGTVQKLTRSFTSSSSNQSKINKPQMYSVLRKFKDPRTGKLYYKKILLPKQNTEHKEKYSIVPSLLRIASATKF